MQECCIFLNGFFSLPTLTPPGPKETLWDRGWLPLRTDSPDTGEVARSARRGTLPRQRVRGGRVLQCRGRQPPLSHLRCHRLRGRTPLSLRDISPHCGEYPSRGATGASGTPPPTYSHTVAVGADSISARYAHSRANCIYINFPLQTQKPAVACGLLCIEGWESI